MIGYSSTILLVVSFVVIDAVVKMMIEKKISHTELKMEVVMEVRALTADEEEKVQIEEEEALVLPAQKAKEIEK